MYNDSLKWDILPVGEHSMSLQVHLVLLSSVEKRDCTFHSVNHAFGVQSRFSLRIYILQRLFVEHELQLIRPILI